MSGSLCILVADDHPGERARLVALLRQQGFSVREAENGSQAVELVGEGGVDLVLLDAYMPRVNGFLAVKMIREMKHDQAPPMLLLIPNASAREAALASRLGCSGFISKPVDVANLLERIQKLAIGAADQRPAALARTRPLTLTEPRAREEILRRIEQIPSLPAVVHELMRTVGQESSRAADIEAIICRDQGLAARVLKLVNSSFFRGQREIDSVSDAVVRLGRNTLQSLALASSVNRFFRVDCRVYGYQPGGLWVHSFAVATTARQIASRVVSGDMVERAFLGGLLHDVGKLVLAVMIEKRREEFLLAAAETGSMPEAEHRVFFHTHAQIGGLIGERWKFPLPLRDIILRHHQAALPEDADEAMLAVMLADRICLRLGLGRIESAGGGALTAAGELQADAAQPDWEIPADVAPPPPGIPADAGEEAPLPTPGPDELPLMERLGIDLYALAAIEDGAREGADGFEVHLAA